MKPGSRFVTRLVLAAALVVLAAPAFGQNTLVRQGRWLTINGQYLVGFDTQELAADRTFDYVTHLDAMQARGVNKVRIWLYNYFMENPATPDGQSALFPWSFNRATRKFNLDSWDPVFWTRMREFVAAARDRGIAVEVTIFAPNNLDSTAGWNGSSWANAWNSVWNVNGAFTGNGTSAPFIPDFFNLGLTQTTSSGKSLQVVQRDLVDKAVLELGGFGNVYFEICNEFPLRVASAFSNTSRNWHWNWLDRVANTTARYVTAHAQQGWGENVNGVQNYRGRDSVDVLNFHFYSGSPNTVANLLHSTQPFEKVLTNNESDDYREDLDRDTRLGWAMLTAGGHFAFYEDDSSRIGDAAWNGAADRLRAMRTVMESLRFTWLSPIDGAGRDYDYLVTAGPSGANRQVLAHPGAQYLTYFWTDASNPASTTAAVVSLPTGTFAYKWYDVRNGTIVKSGTVAGAAATSVPAPLTSQWSGSAGLALTLSKSPLPVGGTLTVSRAVSPTTKNLSSEGTTDWAHWGHLTNASFDRKAGGTQIPNFIQLGSWTPTRFSDAQVAFSWTGGTPTGSATSSTTGLAVRSPGSGFRFTLPASTTAQTLRLYVGVWNGRGRLQASLSGGSTGSIVDTSFTAGGAGDDHVYTVRFAAASAGQTLTVDWIVLEENGGGVTLESATLAPN